VQRSVDSPESPEMNKGLDAGRTKIPEWFSLRKYCRAATLDAAGWYGQISVRRVCGSLLRDMRDPNPIFPEKDAVVRHALTSLRAEPIGDLAHGPFNDDAFSSCRNFTFPNVPVVRSMTFWDFCGIDSRIRRVLPENEVDQSHEIARNLSSHGAVAVLYPPPEWMEADLKSECFWGGLIPLVIDLRFPNSLLVQHFELHLQNLRRREPRKPETRKHSPDVGEWARLGVLPCMDLLLWEDEEQCRITNRSITDALALESNDDKVRKTVRPLATALLQLPDAVLPGLAHLSRLQALAYQDSVQRKEVRPRISKSKADH
jgi:hypothetical protein